MKKMRPFELALVVIFVVLAVVSLGLLATYKPAPDAPEDGEVVTGAVQIWGTLPGSAMTDLIAEYADIYDSYRSVTYRYIEPDRFESTLINALADDAGPDLVLISQEELVTVRKRILPESYEAFPYRDIRNLYLDGAEIFALQDGLHARPLVVDPLVLFWNRDILATEGHLTAPRTWEELVNVQFGDLIDRNFDRTISRSVVAMGEYSNVRNGFGLVSMLLIQGGSLGVVETADEYRISLNETAVGGQPLRSTADFYTRFSIPSNTLYSWNRSLPEDRSAFVAEDLVFYFGFASEGPEIERLNPNLNFDIAEVPQSELATVRRTYGRFYGLALMRTTDNYPGAVAIQRQFSNDAAQIAADSNMVPALRSAVAAGSNETYGRISYQSASIAYGWLSPDQVSSDQIFGTLFQDINENRRSTTEAVSDALSRFEVEY